MPPFPDEAVEGVMQKVVGGQVVGVTTLQPPPSAPSNLGEWVLSGAVDPQGYFYFDKSGARSDDGIVEYRYFLIGRQLFHLADPGRFPPKPPGGTPAPVLPPPATITPALQQAIANDADAILKVYIHLKAPFTTRLGAHPPLGLASFEQTWDPDAERASRLAVRQSEAATLESSVSALLQAQNATGIHGFFTSNAISAKLRAGDIATIAQHPDVGRIELTVLSGYEATWDGSSMKDTGGLNAGLYNDNGYNGQKYAGDSGGRHIRLGVIGEPMRDDHHGFLDTPGGSTRITQKRDCTSGSCSTVSGWTPTGPHSTYITSMAAGSIRQGQISGYTTTQELDYTGVAEEVNILFFAVILDSDVIKAAIEDAMGFGVDVLLSSTILGPDSCDGDPGSDLQQTVYDAQLEEMILVQAAGNDGQTSGCDLAGLAEVPSSFVVGAGDNSCTDSNYATCALASYSNKGGMNATVNGTVHSGALTMLDAIAPGTVGFGYDITSATAITTTAQTGTSFATPQVAGAATLVKDYFLHNGYTSISVDGRLFDVIQAMTDREQDSGKVSNGFGNLWGGGRFQMRYFSDADMGTPWGWETSSAVLSNGQEYLDIMGDTGAEPTGLNQFKAYAMVFESEPTDIADIDLYIWNENCNGLGTILAADSSYDVHSMARLGSSAGGQALCSDVYAAHVPSGETRRVHMFQYYSGGTGMR